LDLIDPNLSIINTIKINQFIIDGIKNLLFNITQISNNSTVDFSIIQEKLNQELSLIIPSVIPDSLFYFNFSISKASLYQMFFDELEKIYKTFENTFNSFIQLIQVNQVNTFDIIWKTFIKDISDLYITIADTFWVDHNKFRPAALRQAKIKAAKVKLFSEAKRIRDMEKNITYNEEISKPTYKKVKDYKSIQLTNGIPGLQQITGKYFILINLKLI
jgi:hypothetical protein